MGGRQISRKTVLRNTLIAAYMYFADEKETLLGLSGDVRFDNPKLQRLRENILEYYERDRDSRGIIFCRTRAMTVALERWMKETDNLRCLNPKRLVATNAPTDKGGISSSFQSFSHWYRFY